MKIITAILLILFLAITLSLGFIFLNKILIKKPPLEDTTDTKTGDISTADKEESTEDPDTSEMENDKTKEEKLQITKIEVYLDGDKNHGIFLGEAEYNLKSPEAELLYGENFNKKGFKLIYENTKYHFEPGSTHYIYVYTYSPASGWDYIREEIKIPGEVTKDPTINIFIDSPKENEKISENIYVSGWALDTDSQEGTGIKEVKIYLDGPKDIGYFLGAAEYGRPRPDVADAFGNQNYVDSGYYLNIDPSEFEPGSKHTLFVYAISKNPPDSLNFEKREIIIAGEKERKSIIKVDINLENLVENNTIEITGWAIDKQSLSSEAITEKQYSIKKIVFASNREGNDNIYSINLDGTELTRLTDHPGNDMYPEVSPDGKKIAYTSDIGGTWQIMVMDWDGKNKKQLTNNPFRSGYPSWSFDGKYIYFEGHIDENWELFRINSDGSNQIRLTFNPKYEDWHPDGHPYEYKIIYESGVAGHEDLYIMDNDGSNIKKICKEHQRRRTSDVLYNGNKIVYSRYTNNQSDIWIMDFNGENEKKLTDNPDWDGHPVFSPDGKYIAYEEKTGKVENIIIMDLNGENKINITNHASNNWDPSFLFQE